MTDESWCGITWPNERYNGTTDKSSIHVCTLPALHALNGLDPECRCTCGARHIIPIA